MILEIYDCFRLNFNSIFMPYAQTRPFLAYMHVHLFRWHKAYLHVSDLPVVLGESTSLHLITFSEENC